MQEFQRMTEISGSYVSVYALQIKENRTRPWACPAVMQDRGLQATVATEHVKCG